MPRSHRQILHREPQRRIAWPYAVIAILAVLYMGDHCIAALARWWVGLS